MLIYVSEEDGDILTKLANDGYFGFKEYQAIKRMADRIAEQKEIPLRNDKEGREFAKKTVQIINDNYGDVLKRLANE